MFSAEGEINLILDAMNTFKSKTCIEFIPRTTENAFINITVGNGLAEITK